MALEPDNVRVALTGAVYEAPKGTTAPTDSTSAYGAGWGDLGWLSDDGIEEDYNDDVKDIKAWQGGQTVRKVISGSEATYKFTCIETSARVLELYHKGSVVAAGVIEVMTPSPDERAFAFDVVDGDVHERIIIPRGEVTERGAIQYKTDEAKAYELTITAYPDEDGLVCIKYSDAASWA